MFLKPKHLAIAVARGSGKEACEVGNRVGIDNPATMIPAQRPTYQEAAGGRRWACGVHVLSGCLREVVSLHQGT